MYENVVLCPCTSCVKTFLRYIVTIRLQCTLYSMATQLKTNVTCKNNSCIKRHNKNVLPLQMLTMNVCTMATNPLTIEIPESHVVLSCGGLSIYGLGAENGKVYNDSVHCDYDSKHHLDFCHIHIYT